ncbi:MAG: large repetitive protein, partial [Frankiaceae bacterium]|nr:large repetitive protein [Frankiaceae bacterium]
ARASTTDPWDPKLAGDRQSVFYPPTQLTHGPGTVDTVLGGRCDGLAGLQTSVSPGNVVVDRSGRIFWVDVGSDLHAQPTPYIRTLDPDGRVRTLGNLSGPVEGRVARGWNSLEGTDVRIVPDQHGGVFYTFNRYIDDGHPAGSDWQARDVPAGAPAIGRLRADGTNEFIAGSPTLPPGRGDGGPVEKAAFNNIAAMAADDDGNLYVADSSTFYLADSSITAYPSGQADGPRNQRFGDDQPGYVAATQIRFLNLSSAQKTFYDSTDGPVVVDPDTVATIAGDGSYPSFTDTTFGTTPSPEPGDVPTAADAARIPFVAGMVVGPHGLALLASSETYRGVGSPFASVWLVESKAVYLLGLNTGGEPAQMYGTSVAAGEIASLGGGAPGYAGDGGPVGNAQFDVRDHDGWFYGDLAADGRGGLLVADTYNDAVRDISAAGIVRTVAGGKTAGLGDRLSYPMGVAASAHGLVVSDWGASRIVQVGPTGHAHLLAGNGQAAYCGIGSSATGDISHPGDLAGGAMARNRAYLTGADLGDAVDAVTDSHGVTYAAIPNYGVVVRIAPDGMVTVAAGKARSCTVAPPFYFGLTLDCQPPKAGAGDGGRPQDAVLEDPEYLLLDQYDNLYVSDGDAVRYVNFSAKTLRPQGHTVRAGTIGTVYRHPVQRLHLPLFPAAGNCQDFCNTYLDVIIGLGAMTLDSKRGTLFVVDQLDQQVLAVNYCGKDYLVAGRAHTLVTQVAALLGVTPPTPEPLVDGKPAYNVDIAPAALAYDSRRDLLLMTDAMTTTGGTSSAGRVLAVNVGSRPVALSGIALASRAIATYAGGSGCTYGAICSYGDGSHSREAAFALPFGLAVDRDGSVYVAEFTNRIRRVDPDGVVGTIAGVSRNIYDVYSFGSAAAAWWFIGGECADGGAAATACFAGLHSMQLDPAGNLVVTDVLSGRVRRITHVAAAPLRPDVAPIRGAGWGFTPAVRLPNLGQESTDASLAVDAAGNVYAMSPMSGPGRGLSVFDLGGTARSMPCAVWSYALDADARGHDAPIYLGEPDLAYAAAKSSRTCSIAASPPGSTALAPPTGSADRLVFGSGSEQAGFPTSNVTAGASRDGAHTFLTSPNAALTTTTPTGDLDNPSVVAIDGDTSGMVFQDTSDGVVDFALSRGGTQYVQLTHVVDTGLPEYGLAPRLTSQPVMRGADGLVPVFPTTITGCQHLVGPTYSCTGFEDTSASTIETVATTNRGLTWAKPSVLETLPCRNTPGWVSEAYCFGYHGLPQLAVDASGTDYLAWDDGHHIVLSHSTDHGATWSKPTQVDSGVP